MKPGYTLDDYLYRCMILPHLHPVHCDTANAGSVLLASNGFIAQGSMTSQRRMHYSRACYFMLFCFEDGDKISL
jgi:hypothetical protein